MCFSDDHHKISMWLIFSSLASSCANITLLLVVPLPLSFTIKVLLFVFSLPERPVDGMNIAARAFVLMTNAKPVLLWMNCLAKKTYNARAVRVLIIKLGPLKPIVPREKAFKAMMDHPCYIARNRQQSLLAGRIICAKAVPALIPGFGWNTVVLETPPLHCLQAVMIPKSTALTLMQAKIVRMMSSAREGFVPHLNRLFRNYG